MTRFSTLALALALFAAPAAAWEPEIFGLDESSRAPAHITTGATDAVALVTPALVPAAPEALARKETAALSIPRAPPDDPSYVSQLASPERPAGFVSAPVPPPDDPGYAAYASALAAVAATAVQERAADERAVQLACACPCH